MPDLLDNPVPFAEAVKHLLAKKLLPTNLSSRDLQAIGANIRRASLFSARTTDESYLEKIQSVIESVLNPQTEQRPDRVTPENPQGNVTTGLNPATARAALRDQLKAIGYEPNSDEAGTIKDLSSDPRLELVVSTNVQLAQGAGQFIQGNMPDAVDASPAWELVRYEHRDVPRGEKKDGGVLIPDPGNSWPTRFEAAAQAAGDEDALRVLDTTDRMIALKSSPLWDELGNGAGGFTDTLGNPFPPFAFNSGMWTKGVAKKECLRVGLINPGAKVRPASFDFGSLLKEAA